MAIKSYLLLLLSVSHLTTQTILSTTRVLPVSPTPIIIGLPSVTTISNSVCNVQATVPSSNARFLHHTASYFTPLSCLYDCLSTTACQTYSWDPSASLNTTNCYLWGANIDTFPTDPTNTSTLFYSQKYSSCISVSPPTHNSSAPFYGEAGLFINRAVHDCGIEGSIAPSFLINKEFTFNYSSILTCQDECDTENGCVSYAYDYTATEGNCRMFYGWIAGVVSVGSTGVFWSDGSRKTGYRCFDTKEFGT